MAGFDLTFHWNEIQGNENYAHNLLTLIVSTRRGTAVGADALVEMLELGPHARWWNGGAEFLAPVLHQHVISILESPMWHKLEDPGFTRIAAEAYETWWSLSRAMAGDFGLEDLRLTAADFTTGSEAARLKAVQLYEDVLKLQPDDEELTRRIALLRQRQDTHQRAWFQGGD